MRYLGFATMLGTLLACLAAAPASAGDSYTLALTWQPAFCADRQDRAECRETDAGASPLVLHGLWPDWDANGDGRRDGDDAYCLDPGPARDSIVGIDTGDGGWKDLPAVDMTEAMKDDLPAIMPGARAHLDRHEWWKHGTCSGLKPVDYFGAAILLTRQMQLGAFGAFLAEHQGESVKLKALLGVFDAEFGPGSARALKLACSPAPDGTMVLSEIQLRLKRERIGEGLLPSTLETGGRAPRGKCGTTLRIEAAR